MIARAPVAAYLLWFAILLSPQVIAFLLLQAFDDHVVVAAAVQGLAFVSSYYVYLALIRHTRRRVLQNIIRRKARREEKPFVLISRSFDQSKALQTPAPIAPGVPVPYLSLFEALIFDLSYTHPIVVLGDKDLHPDDPAGRALFMPAAPAPEDGWTVRVRSIDTDEVVVGPDISWERVFLDVARIAQLVLLIPGATPGVVREAGLLKRENLGSKTVIYMWPATGAHPYQAISASADAWEMLRSRFADHNLDLPSHIAKGALITLSDDFRIQTVHTPLPSKNVLSSIESHAQRHIPLRQAARLIEAYEMALDSERYESRWAGMDSDLYLERSSR